MGNFSYGLMMMKQTPQFFHEPKRFFLKKNKNKTVGIVNPGYGYERVSYSISLTDYQYRKAVSIPLHRLNKSMSSFFRYTSVPLSIGVDLFHTWNALPMTYKPFVVSYECELPRYLGRPSSWQTDFGYKLLNNRRCKRILALSSAARDVFLNSFDEKEYNHIKGKVDVFRGGIELSVRKKKEYLHSESLKLIFVGAGAIRKGIAPLITACETLIQNGIDIHLTVIGDFKSTCYVHKSYMPNISEIYQKLEKYPWIDFQGRVPSDQVLEEIKNNDVMIFPTYDESLGWVPIEAGLLGVPTISTDIFAIPEVIEHSKTGYLISIHKRKDRRFFGIELDGDELEKELNQANKLIVNGLIDSITLLYENRDLIAEWGNSAYEKISKMYDYDSASAKLQEIYDCALK